MKFVKNRKFVGNMFDEISPSYDRMNHIMSGFQDLIWRKKSVRYLSLLDNKYANILDLAAGSGDFGKEFLRLKPEKLYSVDLSIEMLKKNAGKITDPVNRQVKSDAESMPFRDNYFDLCGIGFGVRNFQHLDKCLIEINRVLKNEGILVVIEMFKPSSKGMFDKLFRLYFEKIMPRIGNSVSGSNYAYNYLFESVDNFLSVDEFISNAETAGFRLEMKKKNFSEIVYTVFFKKQ